MLLWQLTNAKNRLFPASGINQYDIMLLICESRNHNSHYHYIWHILEMVQNDLQFGGRNRLRQGVQLLLLNEFQSFANDTEVLWLFQRVLLVVRDIGDVCTNPHMNSTQAVVWTVKSLFIRGIHDPVSKSIFSLRNLKYSSLRHENCV